MIFDEEKIKNLLSIETQPTTGEIDKILSRAKLKKGLTVEEVAVLLRLDDEENKQKLFRVAKKIKNDIYGNRLVFFAPLYVSDYCVNNCRYCGFHCDNQAHRKKLSLDEVAQQVKILEDMGHKRLLLEFGEDPKNNPIDYVVDVIKTIYNTKSGRGEIRRVNVNIAATTVANYKKLRNCGIGTYQLFQETYHRPTYDKLHQGPKADYDRQITAHERAFEAGIDDFGLGVLFGLYDYKYEVLALISQAQYLDKKLGVGPHTISVPRFNPALTVDFESEFKVSDNDFLKIIAIIRLAVPYTGLILSTRESPEIRRQAFQIGISQASAASRASPGGYKNKDDDNQEISQFNLQDHRSLDEVNLDICSLGYLPSYCTACYRSQRTGARFMKLAKTGKIHELCQPNALQTFYEYLLDYALPETRQLGMAMITNEIKKINNLTVRKKLIANLKRIKKGERDLFI
ncbi:MAG: [FeFe] hydrogenase H-cluster radical SAM maturase HydG [Candidatus Buchananbacteria bacterium RIFCSPLOWO2_01_FULL_39_33]|uniref:[FeFe] hydrogenase H-cluster radical SAM maturase HydG n=1 Tax=Candidatus Buchananbacteria bacterium RIFCSPLOWO2_01_FULL_39_33 TaxID=1797543 RepID=A0A1G1YLQ6_9BACT|nr:MAG: [FeFe] hydrogenase H-cluster radical SAM maturase HydG [Candidatus Buchananbacteria bacterium RIFCSPHIGHO2_01_FULL_40_35]OGY53292.1 MAG: [FeFe] hydrogenase H-cluster radical SAM maturase HydG [Candidatus Buchananbacteria bacterium RIFCSPLOWO2_01_FULL_39_33]